MACESTKTILFNVCQWQHTWTNIFVGLFAYQTSYIPALTHIKLFLLWQMMLMNGIWRKRVRYLVNGFICTLLGHFKGTHLITLILLKMQVVFGLYIFLRISINVMYKNLVQLVST